jgi:Toastrack DUF4097
MNTANLRKHGVGWLAVWLAFATSGCADFQSNLTRSFPVHPGGKLVVRADCGSIDLTTADTDRVAISVARTIKRTTQARADEIFRQHEITFTQDGNTVTVTARLKPESSFWPRHRPGLQVHYAITLPRRFNVDLKTFGGSIGVPDLQGQARSETSGGRLTFGHITGAVRGKTFGGSITLAAAGGPVEVSTSGGSVRLGDLDGAASAQTFGGSITAKRVNGTLTAKTSGGSIEIDAVGGDVFAQTFGGSITIGTAGGKVTAKTSGGHIAVDSAAGDLEAKTFGGSITVKQASHKVTAETSGGSIEIGKAGGAVAARTFSGSITAGLAAQPGDPCRLETSGGNIHVRLAPEVAVDLDAAATGGRVVTELPVMVLGKHSGHGLRGKINGGGPSLTVQTHGGSIYLQRL